MSVLLSYKPPALYTEEGWFLSYLTSLLDPYVDIVNARLLVKVPNLVDYFGKVGHSCICY
jgi:hypothetical protein